jgi:hypothetical protein
MYFDLLRFTLLSFTVLNFALLCLLLFLVAGWVHRLQSSKFNGEVKIGGKVVQRTTFSWFFSHQTIDVVWCTTIFPYLIRLSYFWLKLLYFLQQLPESRGIVIILLHKIQHYLEQMFYLIVYTKS